MTQLLVRVLGRDDDYAIAAAYAVQGGVHWILEHFYRSDVVRVNSYQPAVGAGLNWNSVDDIQRLCSTHERADAADAHRNAAIRVRRQHNARDVGLNRLLDRLTG